MKIIINTNIIQSMFCTRARQQCRTLSIYELVEGLQSVTKLFSGINRACIGT